MRRMTGAGGRRGRWSLGALLYEMLNGNPPFYSHNVQAMYQAIMKGPLRRSVVGRSRLPCLSAGSVSRVYSTQRIRTIRTRCRPSRWIW
jgi:serine/threonine protein kinase